MNAKSRTEAKTDFEKDFFLRKNRDIKIKLIQLIKLTKLINNTTNKKR